MLSIEPGKPILSEYKGFAWVWWIQYSTAKPIMLSIEPGKPILSESKGFAWVWWIQYCTAKPIMLSIEPGKPILSEYNSFAWVWWIQYNRHTDLIRVWRFCLSLMDSVLYSQTNHVQRIQTCQFYQSIKALQEFDGFSTVQSNQPCSTWGQAYQCYQSPKVIVWVWWIQFCTAKPTMLNMGPGIPMLSQSKDLDVQTA